MQSLGETLHYVEWMPLWAGHLIWAVITSYTLFALGIVVAKTGRPFWWGLLAVIPYAGFLALAILAFIPWPRIDKPAPAKTGAEES